MNKLTLGTAQLGMKYGINNKIGKPLISESLSILEYAYNKNINSFDTASVYGNSESVLGYWLKEKKHDNIFLTSKLPSLMKNNVSELQLENEIRFLLEKTLINLSIKKIDNYLVHDFKDIKYYGDKIFNILEKLKAENLLDRYGCSIYDIDELEYLQKYDIDSIQIPGSIFNQNILESEELSILKSKGTKIFVRSAFVQGLIFMQDKDLSFKTREISKYLVKLRKMAKENELTIPEIALNYVRNHRNVDSVVFGVETINQIEELLMIDESKELNRLNINSEFSQIPLELVDPRYWG